MPMNFTSLTGSKATPGSIMNWVTYTRLDINTVVDEAQSLLFQMLRCREMRSSWTFAMAIGQAYQSLPPRFLDPVGRVFDFTNSTDYGQRIETTVQRQRSYEPLSGSLGTNPFTTGALGSSIVTVALTAHGLTQSSSFTIAGAANVDGLVLNGGFEIVSVVDANTFTIDVGDLNNDAGATAGSVTGGGAAATYTANKLVASLPTIWSINSEKLQFDCAFDTAATLKLLIYRRPRLLSTSNPTNFVTDRYPTLMRVACLAAAAQYMKDDTEYAKHMKTLGELVGATAAENDLVYRGAEFGTDTP